ncbi:MAG: ParB/RepB/Spo0J family partition protein [Planctomycetes bacterium]|nr:ParB/RepB/Spo0J family partition protein [Planctomycetota bacterium]
MSTATATPVKEEKKAPEKTAATPPASGNGASGKPAATAENFQRIPLDCLKANPQQPRKDWDEPADETGKTALDYLAESIAEDGILQPLVVTPDKDGKFVIVCGERRYKAAKKVGLAEAPCIVRPGLSETDMLEIALTENIQRKSLRPVDEARAFKALMEKCGYTAKALAKKLGLSAAAITYRLSLLGLTPDLQKAVNNGAMSPTDARFVSQEANRIAGPNKEEHRKEVMDRVASTVKQAGTDGKKMTSKEVQAVAKQEVARQEEKRVAPVSVKAASKAPTPGVTVQPTKKVEPEKPKNPSPAEKKQRAEFVKSVERVRAAFKKFEPIAQDTGKLPRFAQVLVMLDPKVDEFLFSAGKTLARIYEQVGVQKKLLSVYGGK